MSRFDYEISRTISLEDYPFYAMVMALYRRADTSNQEAIEFAWPKVVAELKARYDAPGGLLPGES